MARERRPASARSSEASNDQQAKDTSETHNRNEKPAVEKDESSHTAVSSTEDDQLKHKEHQQSSSSEATDDRTFQQLVQDYGDDSKCHFFSRYMLGPAGG
jgi:cell fate (sporulation/competence/biofilm development) regulator YlbF (YheA/YmcA/DUF963 family)